MKTGDRVVCINTGDYGEGKITPILTKGREYIIYDVHKCSCGVISFDVGLITSTGDVNCFCGKQEVTNIHWCYSKRFAKVKQEYKIIHMDIEIEEPILN